MKLPSRTLHLVALAGSIACTHRPALRVSPPAPAPSTSTGTPPNTTSPAELGSRYNPPAERLGRDALRARLPTGRRLSYEELVARHPVSFTPGVQARTEGLNTIQGGPFALRESELARLRDKGFTLVPRMNQGSFLSGYVELYLRDQPVYVSADVVLNALHEGFDSMMISIETDALAPALTRSLERLRASLGGAAGASLPADTRADLDVYLAVTLGLLQGAPVRTVANGDAGSVRSLVERITAAEGMASLALFGGNRRVDLSQMRPRGHYAGVAPREQYFRAVMWLGREGLRLVDVENGQRVVNRREVAAALALHALSDNTTRAAMATVEEAIASFAGEPEALTFGDLDALSTEVTRGGGLTALSDARFMEIVDGVRGDRPRVATTLLVHPDGFDGTVPQPVAFSMTPQRYTPDSRVLSNVSFDRVDRGRVPRMMPDPLDAAFAALGNDQAAALLRPSLTRYDYATELETSRALVDAHEAGYWQGSLYASWMAALRTLSPRETLAEGERLPALMRTEAWGLRMLNTQLAAWAEVRHDTVLYTAQSYSAMPGCSYPAAYVDPYPALWRSLGRWTERARALIDGVSWATAAERTRWTRWTSHAGDVVRRLGEIAERERAGEDLRADQLAWVNQAVTTREIDAVCTTVTTVDGGWLYDLYEPRQQLGEERGVVADVHTEPEDERGRPVGRVLHIGTGRPQVMAVLAGPPGRERAYLGFASSYRERVTEGFDRLTDARWRQELERATAPAWLGPVTAPDDGR
jgi:hypothetical protein